jgi:glycerol-3-phosphate acyltransferase PlsY
LVLDLLKGLASVWIAYWLGGPAALAGLAAVLGHTLTPWLRFQGGKGVATGAGVLYAIAWPLGLAVMAIWLVAAIVGRISSVAALLACAAAPFIALIVTPYPWPVPLIAVWIVWRHQANIARLLAGTEPRIGQR